MELLMMKRTHNNGELRIENIGQEVVLKGWISKVRDAGIMFIVLRDRYGLTQLTVNPETADRQILAVAKEIRNEYEKDTWNRGVRCGILCRRDRYYAYNHVFQVR